LDKASEHKLVEEEGGGVTKVEDQRMSEGFGLFVEGSMVGNDLEKLFIDSKSIVEIVEDFLTFSLNVTGFEVDGTG